MNTVKVLVTGSRHWTDRVTVETALGTWWAACHRRLVVVHGGANGVDAIAAEWAERNSVPTEVYEADWKRHGRAAGPVRNQRMVEAGADVCLAFPLPGSRGTLDCIERAEAAGIKVVKIGPVA